MRGKILLATGLLAVGCLAFWLSESPSVPPLAVLPRAVNVHVAGDPGVNLKQVAAKVVYFVPSDVTSSAQWDWRGSITSTMRQEHDFFGSQLGINCEHALYPELVVGMHDHTYYDGVQTDHGNPHALVAVREEILDRIFTQKGDLYNSNFVSSSQSAYHILVIVYEGTGASAMIYKNGPTEGEDVIKVEKDGPPAIIVSSAFLNSSYYKEFGATILAHEIGHSFGLNDGYDLKNGSIVTDDLMGEGRRRVLSATFISDENKRLLGIK